MTIELTNASTVEYPAEAIMKAIDAAIVAKAEENNIKHIQAEIIEVTSTGAIVELYKRFDGYFETITVNA